MILFDYNKNTRKLLIRWNDQKKFSALREFFSVEDKNATFVKRWRRYPGQTTRKYVITPTGQCDLGLYYEIRKYFLENQIVEQVEVTESLNKALNLGKEGEIYKNFNFSLRDYQEDIVDRAVKTGWGTCVLGTGGGKTLVTGSLIENFYRFSNNSKVFKCLMIVPDIGLVEQTYNEFKNTNFTFNCSKWTGSHKLDLSTEVIIVNMQLLQSQIDSNDWVNYVDLVVVDECHKIKPGNKISKIISSIKTHNRFGFTGTLPQEKLDKWFIIGKLGPLIYEKNSYELRLENYLTNVEVKVLNLQYKQIIPPITGNPYRDELEFIYSNEKRNALIGKICSKLTNNALVLVNHIKHGETLLDKLQNECNDKEIFFIRGEVEVEERERIKKIMEEKNNVVCIAISAIFSTGVNIKNIHNILFVSGGKSFIRTVQSIGRGLRLHSDKTKLTIFDISDVLQYSAKHLLLRKQIYEKEKINFSERIIQLA